MSGELDGTADRRDVAWTAKQLENTLVFNHEYHHDHYSFAIGRDMSYFTEDAMAIFNHYNDICDP